MRRTVLGWALGLLLGAFPGFATEAPRLLVASDAPVEVVFRYAADRCETLHLPDSPARAIRDGNGHLVLFAAHLVNIPLLGPEFNRLRPLCAARSSGYEAEDPAALRDRFWVQAILPFQENGRLRLLGLASHEYMGGRHPGRCEVAFNGAGRVPAAFRCWHSAITPVLAEPGEWIFRPPAPGAAIIASPDPFDPRATRRTGFFSVSNPLVRDGEATLLVYTEGVAGQPRGNCLLRARLDGLPGGWRVRRGGGFVEVAAGHPCDVVGNAVFGAAAVRSVVQIGAWHVAVFTRGGAEPGVYASASRDLLAWLPAQRLWAVTPFRSQPEAGTYFEYPSLIDHASASEVFDAAGQPGAERLHLYLTRFNLENRRQGLNRDLVRVAVQVTR